METIFFVTLCIAFIFHESYCFYIPGVAPREYEDGEPVEIKVRINGSHFLFAKFSSFSFKFWEFLKLAKLVSVKSK